MGGEVYFQYTARSGALVGFMASPSVERDCPQAALAGSPRKIRDRPRFFPAAIGNRVTPPIVDYINLIAAELTIFPLCQYRKIPAGYVPGDS